MMDATNVTSWARTQGIFSWPSKEIYKRCINKGRLTSIYFGLTNQFSPSFLLLSNKLFFRFYNLVIREANSGSSFMSKISGVEKMLVVQRK